MDDGTTLSGLTGVGAASRAPCPWQISARAIRCTDTALAWRARIYVWRWPVGLGAGFVLWLALVWQVGAAPLV